MEEALDERAALWVGYIDPKQNLLSYRKKRIGSVYNKSDSKQDSLIESELVAKRIGYWFHKTNNILEVIHWFELAQYKMGQEFCTKARNIFFKLINYCDLAKKIDAKITTKLNCYADANELVSIIIFIRKYCGKTAESKELKFTYIIEKIEYLNVLTNIYYYHLFRYKKYSKAFLSHTASIFIGKHSELMTFKETLNNYELIEFYTWIIRELIEQGFTLESHNARISEDRRKIINPTDAEKELMRPHFTSQEYSTFFGIHNT